MEKVRELKYVSKKKDEKHSQKSKEEMLKEIFKQVFVGDQIICIKGRRKTGKSTLAMEIIIQNLRSNPENEALLFSSYGNFNAKKFSDLCEAYIKQDCIQDTKEAVTSLMKRVRVIQLESEGDFHDYFSCLEAMILGFSKLTLVVFDSISFFYHDAYVFEKVYGKPLTREMYLNFYLNIFSNMVKQYNITILYTLPQHLVKEYTCSRDYVEEENEEEERKIYEHMKSKAVVNPDHKYPILKEGSIEVSSDKVAPEKFVDDQVESDPIPGKSSDEVAASDETPEVKTIEIKETPELSSNEQEPIITGQGSDNKSDMHEFRDMINESSDDSLSDSSSEKSGEGYKSESGTESSATNEKLSEKIIATMYKSSKPDVIIKLLNISSNSYMMQIKKDNEEFDVNFDITENGIEWDDIPAEN